jgi:hypothetical protein
MVRNTIPREDVNTIRHDNSNDLLVRTLQLTTDCGTFHFHNAYNRAKQIDLSELLSTCTSSPYDFFCGDMNCHSRLWCADDVKEDVEGQELARGIEAAGMCSQLPRGTLTWSRGVQGSGTLESSIDVVFVKKVNKERVTFCDVIKVPGFESDHQVIKLCLDITPNQIPEGRHHFNVDHRDEYCRHLAENVSPLRKQKRVYKCKDDVVAFLKSICTAIMDAADKSMERSKPSTPPNIHPKSWQQKRIDLARLSLKTQSGNADNIWHEQWMASQVLLYCLVIKERTAWYYRRSASNTARCRHRIFSYVRIAKSRTKPPDPPQAQGFIDRTDSAAKIVSDHEQKAWLYAKLKWKNSTRCRETACGEPLPCPALRAGRRLLLNIPDGLDQLSDGELGEVVKTLKPRRTPGRSGISHEALKWGRHILEDLLTELFQQCINFRFYPDDFKAVITKAILKEGKDPTNPLSFRPIAILCCLGSILDKILAKRFKRLAQDNESLIPNLQFGGPGRDTTSALQHLTNWVYSGWSKKHSAPPTVRLPPPRTSTTPLGNIFPGNDPPSDSLHTSRQSPRNVRRHIPYYESTIMSLDITQAYDNVNHTKLLDCLVLAGIPDWLIEMTCSFLVNRRTNIDLNGIRTKEDYWINTGIPQGSPLSPILFLIYAAPVFELLPSIIAEYRAAVSVMGFVDDIGLLVAAPTLSYNCKALTKLHENLMLWAKEQEIDFEPSKYKVMHFRNPRSPDSTICTELPNIPELLEADLEDVLVTPDLSPRKSEKGKKQTKQGTNTNASNSTQNRRKHTANNTRVNDGPSRTGSQASLPTPKQHEHSLRILGVWVDPQLNWEEHVAHIESKVNREIKYFCSISTSTKGPSIQRMRELYLTKLLPIITYACAAWFVYSPDPDCNPKWRFRKTLIRKLQSMQRRCIKVCSGALGKRFRMETLKVLFIENWEVVLHRQALLYRARQLHASKAVWSPALLKMKHVRHGVFGLKHSQSERDLHPIVILQKEAKDFLIDTKEQTGLVPGHCNYNEWRKSIRQFAQARSDATSRAIWINHLEHVVKKQGREHMPAHNGEWGKENLVAFEGLDRSQSTILLQIKTGAIGLNAYLFSQSVCISITLLFLDWTHDI